MSQLFDIGQQANVYAYDIGRYIMHSMNPTFAMKNSNISNGLFDIMNFNILAFTSPTKNNGSSCFGKGVNLFNESGKQFIPFIASPENFYNHSKDKVNSIQELNDNRTDILEANCKKRGNKVSESFYQVNVSFEELDEYRYGIHIFLVIIIMYVRKKTYNLIVK